MKRFDPNNAQVDSGRYSTSFYRDGKRIDSDILVKAMDFYREPNIRKRAQLVVEDLGRAGYIFRQTVFFDNPEDVILCKARY